MAFAVFLDRDGVINRAIIKNGRSYPPKTLEAFEYLPGVLDAVRSLKSSGFAIVVVTNQPDVRTGLQSLETVEAMHSKLRADLPIDDLRACFHIDADMCLCRKPKPGMIIAAASMLGIDLSGSVMVGDRWRDIEAGAAAGCRTIFIDVGLDEKQPNAPDAVVGSLPEAAELILSGAIFKTVGSILENGHRHPFKATSQGKRK